MSKRKNNRSTKARTWILFGLSVIGGVTGLVLFQEGRAARQLDRELASERLVAEAWDLLGGGRGTTIVHDFLATKADAEEARRRLAQALEMTPKNPMAHVRMGSYWLTLRDPNRAIESIRAAIRLDPNLAVAHNNLGIALEHDGQPIQARQSYLKAMGLDTTFSEAIVNLGNTYLDSQPDSAEVFYRLAIRRDSLEPSAHSNLARLLRARGDLDSSIVSARRSVRADQAYARGYQILAGSLIAARRFEEAEVVIRKAMELEPNREIYLLHFGTALLGMCRKTEALAAYRQFADALVKAEDYDDFMIAAEERVASTEDC